VLDQNGTITLPGGNGTSSVSIATQGYYYINTGVSVTSAGGAFGIALNNVVSTGNYFNLPGAVGMVSIAAIIDVPAGATIQIQAVGSSATLSAGTGSSSYPSPISAYLDIVQLF
jgi:hypothetical protein